MSDFIVRALQWVRVLLTPRAPGRHSAAHPATLVPMSTPPAVSTPAPAPAKPPLFDDEVAMVRPYVLLYEQQRQEERRQRQAQRRRALLPALDGVDIGPWWIHGVEVAR